MINFPRSTFTWKSHPWRPDPFFKWPGFVGRYGQSYHVRFNLEARCEVTEEASGKSAELFLGAPCRTEYTIARRNLFQIPSGEWRLKTVEAPGSATRLHQNALTESDCSAISAPQQGDIKHESIDLVGSESPL